MTPLKALLKEVNRRVTANLHIVVFDALRQTSILCPNCDYPQNAERFRTALACYTHARCKVTHEQKKLDEIYGMGVINFPRASSSLLRALQINTGAIRKELESIWPCVECMKKFNPTGRRIYAAQLLPPTSLPVLKEVFE